MHRTHLSQVGEESKLTNFELRTVQVVTDIGTTPSSSQSHLIENILGDFDQQLGKLEILVKTS